MQMPYPALIAALLTTGPTAALTQVGGDLPGDPAAYQRLARAHREPLARAVNGAVRAIALETGRDPARCCALTAATVAALASELVGVPHRVVAGGVTVRSYDPRLALAVCPEPSVARNAFHAWAVAEVRGVAYVLDLAAVHLQALAAAAGVEVPPVPAVWCRAAETRRAGVIYHPHPAATYDVGCYLVAIGDLVERATALARERHGPHSSCATAAARTRRASLSMSSRCRRTLDTDIP